MTAKQLLAFTVRSKMTLMALNAAIFADHPQLDKADAWRRGIILPTVRVMEVYRCHGTYIK